MKKWKLVVVIPLIAGVTCLLLTSSLYLPVINITLMEDDFMNNLLVYQMFALFVSLVVLFITLKISPESRLLLRCGNVRVIAGKSRWLGINGKSSWMVNGAQLALFISLVTGVFMFSGISWQRVEYFNLKYIPFILLLSLTNSLSEELLFRFAIVGNLKAEVSKAGIFWMSALFFGLPHYWGHPNGMTGVIMASALGFVLAKATYETQGIGIAWFIHFLQDVLIFTALFIMRN